jgi:hypothetical protein
MNSKEQTPGITPTPAKMKQSLIDPYCAVDEMGLPVFEVLHSIEPNLAGEYLRVIIEAVNSHASLVARVTELESLLKTTHRLLTRDMFSSSEELADSCAELARQIRKRMEGKL